MLISLQKKLNELTCPSCGRKNVLQATLSCSHEDKKCETMCNCIDCGINLLMDIPENINTDILMNAANLECDLETSSCHINLKKVA